jgi:hypothetical protein
MEVDNYLSQTMFEVNLRGSHLIENRYERTTAMELGVKEEWFQRAVAEELELVLSPCREAGLIGSREQESWTLWGREVAVKGAGGAIDLLILSDGGRIGIIETKLAYNPEARREVVAQVLEYAIHFPAMAVGDLPAIPIRNRKPVVEREIVERKIEEGEYLLVIAGDQIDPRATKLSSTLLTQHMIYGWDLALVELAIFAKRIGPKQNRIRLVPYLSGAVAVEQRHVFRVVIDENRTQVNVEHGSGPVVVNQKWNETKFFAAAEHSSPLLREFAAGLKRLRKKYPDITFDFGRSKDGTLIFRHKLNNILEFGLAHGGNVRFRDYFDESFGKNIGAHYRKQLTRIFPEPMKQAYPYAGLPKFNSESSARLLSLIENCLGKV